VIGKSAAVVLRQTEVLWRDSPLPGYDWSGVSGVKNMTREAEHDSSGDGVWAPWWYHFSLWDKHE